MQEELGRTYGKDGCCTHSEQAWSHTRVGRIDRGRPRKRWGNRKRLVCGNDDGGYNNNHKIKFPIQ